MMNRIKEVDVILTKNGFTRGNTGTARNEDGIWFKRIDTKTRCQTNDDKPGIQVCVSYYDFTKFKDGLEQLEISIRSEPKDGIWIDFKCYGIRIDELEEKLDAQIQKLLKAWEAINE